MEPIKAIPNLILFYQSVFTIVLALALGEAFKQFVAESEEPAGRHIRWIDSLPS